MIHGIITSDWHLGSLRRFFPAGHIQMQMVEIERIYEYAVEQGIKHIFVAGDVSDTPTMDQEAYIELLKLLLKYDKVITTNYICGNHDFNDISRTSMDLLALLASKQGRMFNNLFVHREAKQVEISDVLVNFLPFPQISSIKSDRPCLNISHVEYIGALGDNGREMRSGDCFEQPDCDYNMSGHIHKYQELKSRNALYCGAPYQKTFGEQLPKGIVEFKAKEKNGKMKVKHKFINLRPAFSLVNKTIESSKDFGTLENCRNTLYNLAMEEGVHIPDDLRYQFPNIYAIFDKNSKRRLKQVAKRIRNGETPETEEIASATSNLPSTLKERGYSKADRKYTCNLVEEACAELEIPV
jgi:DNA repair exonuclease SbcCD nuclease subunit